jgi:lysophospholipase L1-like esterase
LSSALGSEASRAYTAPVRLTAVSALLACLLAAAATASAARAPLRIAFVGDSITTGTGASTPVRSYRALVVARIAKKEPVRAKMLAKGGVSIDYYKPAQMPAGQDVVVLELGTNPLGAEPIPRAVADYGPGFDTEYQALVAAIHQRSPTAKLVCLSIWRPVTRPGSIAAFNAIVKRDCTDGAYVNITPIGQKKANLGPDAFHPGDPGHRAIASAILHALHL